MFPVGLGLPIVGVEKRMIVDLMLGLNAMIIVLDGIILYVPVYEIGKGSPRLPLLSILT